MIFAVVVEQSIGLAVQLERGACNAVTYAPHHRAVIGPVRIVTVKIIIAQYNVAGAALTIRHQQLLNGGAEIQNSDAHAVFILQKIAIHGSAVRQITEPLFCQHSQHTLFFHSGISPLLLYKKPDVAGCLARDFNN